MNRAIRTSFITLIGACAVSACGSIGGEETSGADASYNEARRAAVEIITDMARDEACPRYTGPSAPDGRRNSSRFALNHGECLLDWIISTESKDANPAIVTLGVSLTVYDRPSFIVRNVEIVVDCSESCRPTSLTVLGEPVRGVGTSNQRAF